jgi:hypothetical protein
MSECGSVEVWGELIWECGRIGMRAWECGYGSMGRCGSMGVWEYGRMDVQVNR